MIQTLLELAYRIWIHAQQPYELLTCIAIEYMYSLAISAVVLVFALIYIEEKLS